MLNKHIKTLLLSTVLLVGASLTLAGCQSSNHPRSKDNASQTIQRAQVPRYIKPRLNRLATNLSQARLNRNQIIGALAVAKQDNPKLSSTQKSAGGNNYGIFQLPLSTIKQYALKHHADYRSPELQLNLVESLPGFKFYQLTKGGNATQQSIIFSKDVLRQPQLLINRNHLHHAVLELTGHAK